MTNPPSVPPRAPCPLVLGRLCHALQQAVRPERPDAAGAPRTLTKAVAGYRNNWTGPAVAAYTVKVQKQQGRQPMVEVISTVQVRRLGDFSSVDTADKGDLVARLDAMHQLSTFRAYKQETFSLLDLTTGAVVADIGCGTGEDERSLARLVGPCGQVLGFDLSEAMLEQARDRHSDLTNVTFHQASAQALPARDASFDAVRADRVLLHVPDPAATLREMLRVLRPGGRIVISEPDMPGCWLSSNNQRVSAAIFHQIAESCVSPYLARDLWTLFRDAGLDDAKLLVRAVTEHDPASVAKILDFESVVGHMVHAGRLATEQVEAWLEDFRQRGRAGRFAAGVSIFIASATKR